MLVAKDFWVDHDKIHAAGPWGVTLDWFVLIAFVVGLMAVLRQVNKTRNFLMCAGIAAFAMVMVVLHRFSSIWREYGLFVWVYCLAGYGLSVVVQCVRPRFGRGLLSAVLLLFYAVYGSSLFVEYLDIRRVWAAGIDESGYSRLAHFLKPYAEDGFTTALPDSLAFDLISIQLPPEAAVVKYSNMAEFQAMLQKPRFIMVGFIPLSGERQRLDVRGVVQAADRVKEIGSFSDGLGRIRGVVWETRID